MMVSLIGLGSPPFCGYGPGFFPASLSVDDASSLSLCVFGILAKAEEGSSFHP